MCVCVCLCRPMYTKCRYIVKKKKRKTFCSYSPTFQNKGRLYLYVSFLIGRCCSRLHWRDGGCENIVRFVFPPLDIYSILYFPLLSVRSLCWCYSVLIKQLWCERLFSEAALKLLTSAELQWCQGHNCCAGQLMLLCLSQGRAQ